MSQKIPITVAHGDGIGPEIMEASLHIIQAAGAELAIETIEIGEKVYLRGNTAGIDPEAWESLRRTKVFYKAPITTPQGGGFKSLNVTARKTPGPLRQHPALRFLFPLRRYQAPEDERGDRARERRRSLRGHRIPALRRRDGMPEADFASGQRKNRPLRLRIRANRMAARRSPASRKTTS